MSASELLRATIFHTPADAFSTPDALRAHADGGVLIRDGRIVAAGDYSRVRALDREAVTTDWRGGFVRNFTSRRTRPIGTRQSSSRDSTASAVFFTR